MPAETPLRLHAFPRPLKPRGVGPVQVRRARLGTLFEDASFLEEHRKHVHLGSVCLGRVPTASGELRPGPGTAIPGTRGPPTPGSRWVPHASARVRSGPAGALPGLGRVEGEIERDQPDAAPDSVIGAADLRSVVCREPQLELRPELPEVFSHAPGCYRIPSGELLH